MIGGLVIALVGLVPAPAHAERKAEEQTPLTVTITSLSPSAIRPRLRGSITVTGTVTNSDTEPWRDIRLYPFASETPMTTAAELAEAAATPETAEVGGRIVRDKVVLGDLQPGQTMNYTLIFPRSDLPRVPGVYWFGVHVMGSGPNGDDGLADGRARTFLPLLGGRTTPVRAAVLVPLRLRVSHNPDGSVASVTSWQRMLSPSGWLGRLRQVGTAPGGQRLSWLVDPAVLDALRQLAGDNPPRDISATEKAPEQGATESPAATPSPSASAEPRPEPDPVTRATAALASDWLDAMLPVLRSADVLALPYGDLDLSAAAEHDPDIYGTARTRSIAFFTELGISATQVNAPAHGVVRDRALTMTDSATPMVLSDTALPEELADEGDTAPPVVASGALRIAVSSSEAASGGPAPGDPRADIGLRQRLLAEAAVRALDPLHPPLVVTLPDRWRPADPAGFVVGLDQPWLQHVGLVAAMAGELPPMVDGKALRYPASAARGELPAARFSSAEALIRLGRSLQRVLSRNDTVADEVVDQALTGVGYPARGAITDDALASRGWIETQLDQIRVQAPAEVTLSGASGHFAATVVNGFDQPVTVTLRAVSDPGIDISAPKSVQIAASGRMTVLLDVGQARAGMHGVSLQLVDSEGEQIGEAAYVPIRAAQVSKIIWLFLGLGGALLFGAIGLRLVRRIRTARSPERPDAGPDQEAPAERAEPQVNAGE